MPWGISHDYKFMFIHIPKTAGTTICSSWEGSLLKEICKSTGILGGTHKSAMQLKEMYPKEFKEYFKFTVVRNPYDRFVSKFFFKQLNPREDFDLEWTDKESEGLLPQVYWITDRSHIKNEADPYDRPDTRWGRIIIDCMVRYENLNEELSLVLKNLGISDIKNVIPHFRQTRTVGDYRDYYSTASGDMGMKMRSIVKYLYREDLKRLNYEW